MGWFAQIRKVGTIYMLHYGEDFMGMEQFYPPRGGLTSDDSVSGGSRHMQRPSYNLKMLPHIT